MSSADLRDCAFTSYGGEFFSKLSPQIEFRAGGPARHSRLSRGFMDHAGVLAAGDRQFRVECRSE